MKEKMLLLCILLCSLCSPKVQAQKDTAIQQDSLLIADLFTQKFKTGKTFNKVNPMYIPYKKAMDKYFSLAASGKKFNDTDLKSHELCNARLAYYGKALQNNKIEFLVYEEEWGGMVGKVCDIFETGNERITRIVSIYITPRVKNLRKLRKAIKAGKFTIVKNIPSGL